MTKKQPTRSTNNTSTRKVSRVPSNIPPGGFSGRRKRYDDGGKVK